MVTMAFTAEANQFVVPIKWIPEPPTLQNFHKIFADPLLPLARWFLNSLLVASVGTVIILFVSSLSGYAFARLEFPGKNQLFSLLLFSLMIPAAITLIPSFLLLRDLKLLDTYHAIWWPAAASVTGIFLLRQHFYSIPSELEDAARVDGAGRFRIFWQVCLPLVTNSLAALAIFTFLGLWNDLFWPLIVLTKQISAHAPHRLGGAAAGELHPARVGLRRSVCRDGARPDFLCRLPAQDHRRHHDGGDGRPLTQGAGRLVTGDTELTYVRSFCAYLHSALQEKVTAMSTLSAQLYLDTKRTIGEISPLLFGGFAEHMGRCIYEGIYDPESPHADERGLRRDVLAALRELNFTDHPLPGRQLPERLPLARRRRPAGEAPARRELAWQSIETNQFGTNEFMEFCRQLDTQPMLGVNLGTGTIEEAANLVEYCNGTPGSYYADLRVANGHPEPHGVQYWCLGNEMDGPWQIGHLDMDEYGRKAREAAKMMKWQDPSHQARAVRLVQHRHAHLPGVGSRRPGNLLGAGGLPLDALLRRQPR